MFSKVSVQDCHDARDISRDTSISKLCLPSVGLMYGIRSRRHGI